MADGIEEGELLAEVRRVVHETRERIVVGGETPSSAYSNAYADSCARSIRLGSTAGIIAGWLIDSSGKARDPSSSEKALALLQSPEKDDGLGRAVLDLIKRVAGSQITDRDFLAATRKPWGRQTAKTGRIRNPTPQSPSRADTMALGDTLAILAGMLAEAAVTDEQPDPLTAWTTFREFARRPVVAPPPTEIENDMCLFQWGTHDWGEGRHFEYDVTRQFVLHDGDGDYDHMKQLSLTLLFDSQDADLIVLGSGEIWSDDDLDNWASEVERLPIFAVVTTKVARRLRLEHTDV